KGRGAKAGPYAQFLLKEFIPTFQRQYPVSREAAQQVVAGFSLGGLSAFDLAWNHPEQFAKAGIFSGALW
ncbi:MAG: esterase family protein, partial [Phaeodactylibacter sp.]|nr:esterase family protein [Phaeodactylibacter sp.]